MDAAYGISRTRDKKGVIIKQTTLPWVNCIHTMVGGGHFPCTGVIEIYDNTEDTTGDEEGLH